MGVGDEGETDVNYTTEFVQCMVLEEINWGLGVETSNRAISPLDRI